MACLKNSSHVALAVSLHVCVYPRRPTCSNTYTSHNRVTTYTAPRLESGQHIQDNLDRITGTTDYRLLCLDIEM